MKTILGDLISCFWFQQMVLGAFCDGTLDWTSKLGLIVILLINTTLFKKKSLKQHLYWLPSTSVLYFVHLILERRLKGDIWNTEVEFFEDNSSEVTFWRNWLTEFYEIKQKGMKLFLLLFYGIYVKITHTFFGKVCKME